MLYFINIKLQIHQPNQIAQFQMAIKEMPEVLECYYLTGKYDYLLKVAVDNRRDLERFVTQLTLVPSVARILTSLVLI